MCVLFRQHASGLVELIEGEYEFVLPGMHFYGHQTKCQDVRANSNNLR